MVRHTPTRSYDDSEVFANAMQFHTTCNFLLRVNPATEGSVAAAIGYPLMALSALTLELMLKTLHAIHSPAPVPQIHDLGKLYRGLDNRTRVEIEKGWAPVYSARIEQWSQIREHTARADGRPAEPISPSVEIALTEGAQAFERFRYTFALRDAAPTNYYVDDLRGVLVQIILKKRPMWGGWSPQSRKLLLDDL